MDRKFKADRTLCPVWPLRYYLDQTKDLRGSQSLLFISFKKGHTSDIRPAALSSWLKQTILQADQQSLDLIQVKVHDIRAFAASKVFLMGYRWTKSCKLVTGKLTTHLQIYLKYLTFSDNNNNMYLGPVVAAQQVLDPSPQTSHPRREKKGGDSHCSQVCRSLNSRVKVYDYLLRMLVRSFIFYFSTVYLIP